MMSSTTGGKGGGDYDEDFPPNPFRSTMTGEVPQAQQPPQQVFQQPQGDFFQPYATPIVTDPLSLQQPSYATANAMYATAQPYPQQQLQQQQVYAQQPPYSQQQQMSMYPQQQQQQYLQQPPPQAYLQPPVAGGRMDNKMEAAANNSNTSNTTPQARFGGGPMGWMTSCFACCTIETYKLYFDLDTEDIKNRIKAAVTSFYKADFFRNEVLGVGERTESLKGPDLYGPFWITMTLIFVVAVVSNVDDYIHRDKIQEFEYDMNHLVRASSILLFFVFCVPSIFWLLTQCMAMQALLMVEWICIYGYSVVIYIPAVMLCLIPSDLVAWIVLSIATAMSALLVVRNVATALLASDTHVGQAKASPLITGILGTHAIFLLVLKLTFFQHSGHHSKK